MDVNTKSLEVFSVPVPLNRLSLICQNVDYNRGIKKACIRNCFLMPLLFMGNFSFKVTWKVMSKHKAFDDKGVPRKFIIHYVI